MSHLLRFFSARRLTALAVVSLLLAGCGTGGTTVLVPVNGGREKVRVEFTAHGPAHASAEGFEVMAAGFIPYPAPKKPELGFSIVAKGAPPLRRINVEDITEEAPVTMFTDEAPVFKDGTWWGIIKETDAHDPRIDWLYRANNDLRIYRFTLTTTDGRTLVLDHPSNFPTFLKAAIRASFGEKP
jgi:hypothetical protein